MAQPDGFVTSDGPQVSVERTVDSRYVRLEILPEYSNISNHLSTVSLCEKLVGYTSRPPLLTTNKVF